MRRIALTAIAAGSALSAAPASARTVIAPYIAVAQVIDADLNGGGDTLTYTSLAAGVDASITGRRSEATLSYRYERRIPWGKNLDTVDVHSGLANGRLSIVPNLLNFEAGAIATRARSDIRGAAPANLIGDSDNITQVYGIYAGPSIATNVGPLTVAGSYRFGYVKVEDRGGVAIAPGQPRLDNFDHSTSHTANASVGMPSSGDLPFGWTVSGGYEREDASQLDQRYEGKYVRADVTVPVSPTVAVTGGVGYEDIKASQRAPVRDAQGVPVTDGNGRYVTDPNSPRLLSYATDGLIYDAGVIWRPNRRFTLQVRAGHRYGGFAGTGSLEWVIDERSGLQIGVYDGIQSFGRSLTNNLASLPTSFTLPANAFDTGIRGCVVGTNPGTGGCLEDTFQSITSSNFRSRGVYALYSTRRGVWHASLGAGYDNRKYLAPVEGTFFTLNDVEDQSYFVQGSLGRLLTANSGVDGTINFNYYNSGIRGASDVSSTGATGTYYHDFGRLRTQASVGIYAYDQDGFDSDVRGQLLLGARYQF